MPADNSPSPPLAKLYKKAVTRSEKLEKTLTKIIASNEPRSDIEALLKDVRRGLKVLRKGPTAPLPLSDGSAPTREQAKVEEGESPPGPVATVRSTPRRTAASRKVADKGESKPRRIRAAANTQ